ncbi:MAG: hypothetical protein LC746_02320, partial [Acidobacteria bacterium]|nr:hypothetical protein [Acidobacteriota bacterium]
GGSGDPPIIITGGNSVHVGLPHSFADDGSGGGHKKFKHGSGSLSEIVVDGTTIQLNQNSRIEIRYK